MPETVSRGIGSSTVGRKILMAVTGQMMILFAVIHVVGNSTIYFSGLNSYAEHLHELVPLVWATRFVMLPALLLHVFFGVQLALENNSAKESGYSVNTNLRSTFASRNMIWSGTLIAAFLVYHLMHFTFQVISPEAAASANADALGRPDVAGMVIYALRSYVVSLVYIFSLTGLFLHLAHGAQSSFQSLGLSNEGAEPAISKGGYSVALVIFIAYVLIPVLVVLGIVKG
ncbi:MAG: succinate dehydrogenase cytochrome b subunit [Thermodesulfovibrionales bacterium]|nr:succinate dehydrogenase cytochrome b subunit [Thermodesulfovibrionales bacterium]